MMIPSHNRSLKFRQDVH
uniref:Uncharacterized protein n=1 Tax=Arundo donax TaxID=35708 RepID=A0A0A8YX75_ARUDO